MYGWTRTNNSDVINIHFAPLQGYTEDAYRRIHNKLVGGVCTYYTPFIRLEHGGLRSKDMRDIKPEYNEGVNVIPQIIACDGKEFADVLGTVRELGYTRVDVNMGCPFTLQTRHGRGAGLLANVDKVKEICDIIRSTDNINFSVKMRLGYESPNEWCGVLPVLNDTPLTHIVVHPRIATQQYRGAVDMDAFEKILNLSSVPIIYNGDITTLEDIRRIETTYPDLAGVMIGRGLLARPSLAREYVDGKEWTRAQRFSLVRSIHAELLTHMQNVIPNEIQLLNKVRSFWEYMEPELGKKPYKKIMKAGNLKNYLKAIEEL